VVHHNLLVKKPTHLTWVQAASVLETFLTGDILSHCTHTHVSSLIYENGARPPPTRTALQALIFCGDLSSGEDVLVHAGASGVGVAACQIARMYGA